MRDIERLLRRLRRVLRRHGGELARVAVAAWMTAAGVLAHEWDTIPDAAQAPQLQRAQVDAALRDAVRRTPPLPAGERVTVAATVKSTLPGGWFVKYEATVSAIQEFEVGARGDVKEPVPGTARFGPSVVTAITRWQPVVALLVPLLALTACALWVHFGRAYDAFICYPLCDYPRIAGIVAALRSQGLHSCIAAGDGWQEVFVNVILETRAALIFVGRSLGEGQTLEARFISTLAKADCTGLVVKLDRNAWVPNELLDFEQIEVGDGEGPSGDAETVRKVLEALDRG